ncbi:phage tail tip lysozyme [Paraburkholderia hospita]|uniref:phage tail tip lysozyme n=1 Tax=Paraburkholderia hospita TaxID=169430 RepID=UPI000B3422A0|nr:phage tail tip lysozyme [Paraburkholderia hospita]OUL79862.1 phage tail protein [Paraburkholderia hospita]
MASKISIAITAKNQASGPIAQVTNSLSRLQAQANKGKLNNLGSSIAAGFSSNGGAISEIASFVGKAGIIGGITALTFKIAQLESQWASSVRSMSNLAVRSGLSTTSAFGVQYAGRLAGLSPEQANAGIEQVRQTYSDAINNRNPEALKRFQAAGISTDPSRIESIESVLTKLAAYADVLRQGGKYGGAQNFLNAAGAGSLGDFLNRGPAQVAADLAAAKAYIPDEQDVQRAREYADASARLGITYDRLKTTILSGIEPGLNSALNGAQFFLDALSGRSRPQAQPSGSDSTSQRIWDGFERFGNSFRGNGAVTMAQRGQQTAVGDGGKLEQARSMVEWYMNHGASRTAAIGIVANASRESSLDERAVDATGKFRGYFQWGPERRAAYERMFGRPLDLEPPERQMAYSVWELNHTETAAGRALTDARDPADAAAKFSSLYERPTDVKGEAQIRAGIARDLDSQLGQGVQGEGGKVRVEIVHKNAPPGTSTNVTSSPNVDTQLTTDRQQAPLGDQYAYSPGNF